MKVALADLGRILTGNTPKKSDEKNYSSNDIYFIKPSDFVNDRITQLYDAEHFISHHAESSARVVPSGSVLVTCIGIIGKVAITKKKMAFNQQINAIIPVKNIVNEKFLAYALLNKQRILQEKANAPVVPIINKGDFSKLTIDIYELEKQRKICDRLEYLENIIKYRQEQLNLLDGLVKSRFVEMFGDPVRNEKKWIKGNMQSICIRITDGEHGSVPRSEIGHPFLNAKHIKPDGAIDWKTTTFVANEVHEKIYRRCNPETGDILVTTTGTIGNVAIVPDTEPFSMDRGITLLKLQKEKISSIFIAWLLKFNSIQEIMNANIHASAIGHLFLNKVKQLPVIIPPLELQNEFSSFVIQVDKSRLAIQKSLDETQLLFDSLMQKYFG